MSGNPNCDGIEVAQTEEYPSQSSRPLDWATVVAAIQPSTGIQSRAGFSTPQYFGTICESFATQQEAQFHYMNGSAPPSLDAEGDGMACEFLPSTPRQNGHVSRDIIATGMGVKIIRASSNDFYLRLSGVEINGVELSPFSTSSFPSSVVARDHYYRYYSNRG